jgi:tetratricopeptide (TPR) repeat protein
VHGVKKNLFIKVCVLITSILAIDRLQAQSPPAAGGSKGESIVLEAENKVEFLKVGTSAWIAAPTNQVLRVQDRFRTGFKSRATLRLSNQGILRVSQLTTLEIQPPSDTTKEQSVLDLKSGTAYFFNRDQPVETQFKTPQASGAIRGTEFNIDVAEDGRTVVTLLDGAVDLTNAQGQGVSLTSGEQGTVEAGKAPTKTAVLDAINIIQWGLYYPAVLDVAELGLKSSDQPALNDSLSAYQKGDLLQALASYPTNRTPAAASEKIYFAALQLAVGQVKDAEALLGQLGGEERLAGFAEALRKVIAAVKFQTWTNSVVLSTATGWMAESYYQQSRSKLEEALQAARNATEKAPQFGFAWARLAEMEFSFGRTAEALAALEKGLQLSPRNAQALSLKGFLLAAQNRIGQALELFDQAIAIDGALGNAWLGRGLCRIRSGDGAAGREDLQVAATLEPHRAVLRSYLAKAYSNEGDLARASKEIDLAKKYDPNDPTSWLYSALLNQQRNQVNQGVRDLEKSQELNDNRSVFRSRLLLDQDRAVRSANLAKIYQDAGMTDLSVREASRAVNSDYGNFSSHLFLANSYDALRDPRQVNLRYETPWFSELLLANLLAPVGAGSLSQNISQQEYSRLFERDRLGLSSSTEYLSSGDWIQSGSQFGTFGNTSYAIDGNYRTENGQRPNNDVESLTISAKFKQQLTPKDSLFVQAIYYDFESGDVAQYYRQANASQTLRVSEKQEPLLFLGYHREWNPGLHTLFLAGRLDDTFKLNDSNPNLVFLRQRGGATSGVLNPIGFGLDYESGLEAYTTELQQIWQTPKHNTIVGAKYQWGWSDTSVELTRELTGVVSDQDISTDLNRFSIYGYHQWQVLDSLRLTAGLSYDRLHYPRNIDTSPITDDETDKNQVSPKAGFLWTPITNLNVRGIYSRSLGGVFFDSSVRLEPTQVAGFNQGFRSLIPESIIGLVPGTEFETFGLGLDHKFKTGTYVGVDAELLTSEARRTFGVLTNSTFLPVPDRASTSREALDFEERSLVFTVNQLIDKEWSVGARYRLARADFDRKLLDVPAGTPGTEGINQDVEATLHQLNMYAIYSHRCGFFSQFHSIWNTQSNHGYAPDLPGDDFWQFNFFAGYRFPRRLAEIRLGILNLTDRDYRLNPLNLYFEQPRERTFTARLRFSF